MTALHGENKTQISNSIHTSSFRKPFSQGMLGWKTLLRHRESPIMERQSMNERATNQKERAENVRKASRLADQQKNPCLNEQELSYRCLGENDYDKDKCAMSFQNYINCKEFWSTIMKERRRNGVKPVLPVLKDREDIRKEKIPWAQKYTPV